MVTAGAYCAKTRRPAVRKRRYPYSIRRTACRMRDEGGKLDLKITAPDGVQVSQLRPEEKSCGNILQILKSATVEDYRPIVFWSINSALTEKEICRQVAEMRSFGLGDSSFTQGRGF